jgi:hypothetical protein
MKILELNQDYTNDFEGKYGFEFDHTFVINPITSFCGRFGESPENYGFKILDTGWDCIAYSQEFMFNGKKVLMIISDGNNLVNDKSIYANIALCNPDLMGEDFQASIIDQYTISR